MRSMTGFGQGSASGARHQASVTLRSVNGRFLDLVLRVKEEYRELEAPVRTTLEAELQRGRVEANVEVRPLRPLPARVVIQTAVVEALHRSWHELSERGLVGAELTLGDLLRLPEVIAVETESDELGPDEVEVVLDATRGALSQLVAAREQEGEQLRRILGERLAELGAAAARLRERAPAVRADLHENLRRRLRELGESPVLDEVRLAQEVALLVDRSDVAEELDRLEAHLQHFRELLDTDGSLGKRLDFLTQEILRELNTLGSKCRDSAMAHMVLDAKVACEQLREQAQNVE